MVCLFDSRLFRETNIPETEFESVFQRSPFLTLTLKTVECLWSFLEICDYFMIDRPPFEEVKPYKHLLCSIEERHVPHHLKHVFSILCVAFEGDAETVLQKGDVHCMEWVHRHRFPFKSRWYEWMINKSVMDIVKKMDMLYECGIYPSSYSFEVALQKKDEPVMNWLLHHNVPLVSYHLSLAIRQDFPITFLETLVTTYHCPLHSHTVAYACSYGRLDVVEWWHQKDFPFCTSSPAWAALWGRTEVLRFLIETNKPIHRSWTCRNAYTSKNSETIHLLSTMLP